MIFRLEQGQRARSAFSRFGKGRHPAALNYGDCFSYALAMSRSLREAGAAPAHSSRRVTAGSRRTARQTGTTVAATATATQTRAPAAKVQGSVGSMP
jgi:hypothetical protein